MKISVIGTGYVGLIQAAWLAKLWFKVNCIDSFEEKINKLKQWISPIYEDWLEELLHEVKDNLNYTTDISTAKNNDIIFLCVGTPQDHEWKTDLSQIKNVANKLKSVLSWAEIIITKSTVPVWTNNMLDQLLDWKNTVISNPEFLREWKALHDFFNAERIVLWFSKDSIKTLDKIEEVYAYFIKKDIHIIITDRATAELIKYASNSFLATKISFINEIAQFSDSAWANIHDIITWMWLDSRIWKQFLNAWIGYGGSCFPKDVKSLIHQLKDNSLEARIISTVDAVNKHQIHYFLDKIEKTIGTLKWKRVWLIWLAFKPDTDDIRESKWVELCKLLIEKWAIVHCFDYNAKARNNFENYLNAVGSSRFETPIYVHNKINDLFSDIGILIITIEDVKLQQEDRKNIFNKMSSKYIFDGRNILNKKYLENIGFHYYGIGQ